MKFFEGATQLGQGNLNASGDATFAKNDLPVGDHAITAVYQGSPTFEGSTCSPVTQTVNAVPNVPPTKPGDSCISTQEDTQLSVGGGGSVLKNDDDPDGPESSLTAHKASEPAHGTVTLALDGTFTYTPNADFNRDRTYLHGTRRRRRVVRGRHGYDHRHRRKRRAELHARR